MIPAEYTVQEVNKILSNMSKMYDLVRIVDPKECRVLEFSDDCQVSMSQKCYNVWHSDQRCTNCSSAAACRTGLHKEKTEFFNNKNFSIQSNPIHVRFPDGSVYDAVMELISISPAAKEETPVQANDRAAENVENHAALFHSTHDHLTRLLNSDAFFQQSREKILKDPDADWLMVAGNIKDFRMINDQFGVLKGNEVLVKCADLMKEISDAADGLCARLSADQFVMLLQENQFEESSLQEVSSALSAFDINGVYALHIHFGVYRISDPFISVSVMCDRANTALKSIKEDARALVAYYDEKMYRQDLFDQKMISGFKTMLKNGQFQMYLQPLTKEDGTAFGAEALVRCILPDGTVIAPGNFIETLERAGIIHELDVYIWEMAIRQLSLWKNTDKSDLTISVNMSAKDFYNIDIYRVLTDLIAKYDVDVKKLRLEITETALINDPEKVNGTLEKLKAAGFFIEIDDFGKGYSSLSMLKDIHADMLKIDMGFLRETKNKDRSDIILGAVIDMADSLGMEVITEGVETEAQLRSLSAMGCHSFQGFYFSRPIPAEEFDKKY